MFTNDALYSFILYTGTNQQPTTYESNDDVVIKGANLYKVAMVATGERCFGHF